MGRILVGTSGFQYDDWRGVLYPEGLPQARWLARYAEVLGTVELNVTFYHLPTPAAAAHWREVTPARFLFAVKGSRYLTHVKRLRDAGPGLRRFFRPLARLAPKLAVVLWQLPPRTRPDLERLEAFLRRLPRSVRHAFEFRGEAWYGDAVCELLDRHGAAFCEHDLVEVRPPRPTGGFRYLRFHGTAAGYSGRYGRAALRPVADDLRRWRRRGDAYVYFNNDVGGAAVRDALELRALLAGPEAPGPRSPSRAARAGAPLTGGKGGIRTHDTGCPRILV